MASFQQRDGVKGKTYRAKIRLKGFETQTKCFKKLSDAKKWAVQIESDMREGRHFQNHEGKKRTLKDLIDRYFTTLPQDKLSSGAWPKRQLDWWKEKLGSKLIYQITAPLIAEYRDILSNENTNRKRKREPSTVLSYIMALSTALETACNEWDWIAVSPMNKVKKPSQSKERTRFLDGEERSRLLKQCKDSESPHLYTVIVLALSTGMRRGEIMNLCWKDIDLKKGRITLNQTKNGEPRCVSISGEALNELIKLNLSRTSIASPLIFPSNKTQGPIDLRFYWERALKSAGIKDFRFHDLRHCCASYLAMNGASPIDIAKILGHKTLSMVKRYAHLSESHTAEVLKNMNEKIFG